MCCTCFCMLSASSKYTPMFFATVDTGTTILPSSMSGIESLVFICGAHITIISVFVALNFSLFIFIQSCHSATQSWMRVTAWIVSSSGCGLKARYSWVSSAYRWTFIPCRRAISPSGAVWQINMSGPRTEPCGTPNTTGRSADNLPCI